MLFGVGINRQLTKCVSKRATFPICSPTPYKQGVAYLPFNSFLGESHKVEKKKFHYDFGPKNFLELP